MPQHKTGQRKEKIDGQMRVPQRIARQIRRRNLEDVEHQDAQGGSAP